MLLWQAKCSRRRSSTSGGGGWFYQRPICIMGLARGRASTGGTGLWRGHGRLWRGVELQGRQGFVQVGEGGLGRRLSGGWCTLDCGCGDDGAGGGCAADDSGA